jgi:hypothetical protein
VYYPKLYHFWLRSNKRYRADEPLVRYCKEQFKPMARVGNYDLCFRPGEKHSPLAEAANVAPLPAAVASQFSQWDLPGNASPNVMLEVRPAADIDGRKTLARIVVVNADNGKLLADSSDESPHGMKVLDADLHPIPLPLAPGWNLDSQTKVLNLIPYLPWSLPKDYDYSHALVGLFDSQENVIAWLPVAIPLSAAQ